MKAIFEGLGKGEKSKGKSEEKSEITNEYLRYREPLNDKQTPLDSPGGEGTERRDLSEMERELRDFYNWKLGDKVLPKKERERYRQRPAKTPPGRGTLRSYRAQNILRNDREDPEVSPKKFARLVDNPRYADLLARKRKSKKGGKKGGKKKNLHIMPP